MEGSVNGSRIVRREIYNHPVRRILRRISHGRSERIRHRSSGRYEDYPYRPRFTGLGFFLRLGAGA